MEALLTPEEVARRLRISRRTVLGWLQAGRLRGVKVGNRWRVEEGRVGELVRDPQVVDSETQEWLGAPLSDDLPPYDWGSLPEPRLLKVEYRADDGLVIVGAGRNG